MRVYSMSSSRQPKMTNSKPPTMANQHLCEAATGLATREDAVRRDGRACVLILDLDLDSVYHVACLI